MNDKNGASFRTDRKEKAQAVVRELVTEFLNTEANRTSLVTVTGSRMTKDLKHVTILLSVMPTEQEEQVLHFARRKRSEVKEFLKSKLPTARIPFVEFEIDQGEKNRQRIEELANE
ncbi:MAG: ribosome-binding factor A [Parcubacteria group bacterium]|nr:ribosome-binding factor A [Parcubacteria group bacterium]